MERWEYNKEKRRNTFYKLYWEEFFKIQKYCKCGCGNKIKLLKVHKYTKIPNYIVGHQNRVNHPMKNRNHTAMTKQLISQNRKGKGLNNQSMLGHKHTEEWKRNHSIKLQGKHHSEETKRKIGYTNYIRGTYDKNKERLQRDNISKYVRNPSKPQLKLYNFLKRFYIDLDVLLNHKVPKINGGNYYLDIAIPELMLDYEYDGEYWHLLHKLDDQIRDKYLTGLGWQIIRINEK